MVILPIPHSEPFVYSFMPYYSLTAMHVYTVAQAGRKPPKNRRNCGFLKQILGSYIPTPPNVRQISHAQVDHAGPCLSAKFHLHQFISSSWGANKSQILPTVFLTLSLCDDSAQRCKDKVECECTTANLPLSYARRSTVNTWWLRGI